MRITCPPSSSNSRIISVYENFEPLSKGQNLPNPFSQTRHTVDDVITSPVLPNNKVQSTAHTILPGKKNTLSDIFTKLKNNIPTPHNINTDTS